MKAYVLRSYGSPDVLQLTELPTPVPGHGEVLVRVRATSVQPYDWHLMRGEPRVSRLMPGPLGLRGPKITVLGADVAGQVEAIGPGVTGFRPGDDVFAMPQQGGFGEYVCVPEKDLAPMPAGLSYEEAAALPLAAGTALLAVRDVGRVRPGQRVLVNGASGGVGTFAVQLAKALGARVAATVGSAAKAERVRELGADEVVNYREEDFADKVEADVILDIMGAKYLSGNIRALRTGGRLVVIGLQGGRKAELDLGALLAKRASVHGTTLRSRPVDEKGAIVRSVVDNVWPLVSAGAVRPVVYAELPMSDAAEAHRMVDSGEHVGKILLVR